MGIFEWVQSQTGAWGPALLDFYFQYAGWINAIVVTYGLLLLLSWQNLFQLSNCLVEQILDQAREMKTAKGNGDKLKPVYLTDFLLSWERALATRKFPFVARQNGFIIRRSKLENVRAMITQRDLYQRCFRQLAEMGFRLEQGS